MIRKLLGIAFVGACGWTAALAMAEQTYPGVSAEVNTATAKAAVPAIRVGGVVGGEVLRSTGPIFAGAKDAVQTSGIGGMLSGDTPVQSGGVPVPDEKPAAGAQP